MQTLAEIRELLADRGMSPRHRLGQNFLIDHNLIRKLVDAADLSPGELVLEIGPGTGTMTEELLDRGCEVIACELDPDMVDLLGERFGEHPRLTLIRGDCLASKHELSGEILSAIGDRSFKLVSNLPYGAATPVMLALVTGNRRCRGQFVTIQREVADRLGASPGSKAYGGLSVVVQTFAETVIIARLPNACFWPRPEVASAMVALIPKAEAPEINRQDFAHFCQALMQHRRKQLGRTVRQPYVLPEGLDRTRRAESLTPAEILSIYLSAGIG
ncbi:MAG TPA: ribosomal RNA small subunit methyltransferase A [Phycisphaerales bacterium]|nr:ribosomal RNA small subunit methyltransferase A [Phycisphaerales bacterium]